MNADGDDGADSDYGFVLHRDLESISEQFLTHLAEYLRPEQPLQNRCKLLIELRLSTKKLWRKPLRSTVSKETMVTSARFVYQLGIRTGAKFATRSHRAAFHIGRIALLQSSTVNKNVAAVEQHKSKLEGSYHWSAERALSAISVPLIGAAVIMGPTPMIDLALGVVLPLHCHIGFDSILVDYLHERKWGKFVWNFNVWALRLLTALTIYGCYQFNTNDVGLTAFVKRLWTGKVDKTAAK
ncbi:hypothetical protein SeLEV6574_g02782 [Synchytrium endobioticum]|uniref:Succinate dehydrogenase [ubiquinone] cytochrome b small subunit n=1 Tax=Synchytrium endobioticum TaxID=286115 RepID=A0A507D790_9FUNG|nr:hypothetical protein SeLEV6574_g02782 [Synchytrium endobioticum]